MKAPFFPYCVIVFALFSSRGCAQLIGKRFLVLVPARWHYQSRVNQCQQHVPTQSKNRFRGRVRALGRDRSDCGPDRRPARQANNAADSIVRTSADSPVTRAQSTRGQFTHAARARRDCQPSQTSARRVAIAIVCIYVQVFMPDKIEDKRFLSPQERRAVCDMCLGILCAVEGVIDIEEIASLTLARK